MSEKINGILYDALFKNKNKNKNKNKKKVFLEQ